MLQKIVEEVRGRESRGDRIMFTCFRILNLEDEKKKRHRDKAESDF